MCLLLCACAGSASQTDTSSPAPSYAPVETVTVRATVGETTRRLIALYATDGITIAASTDGTITTAPVQSVSLRAGTGATGATGTADYFYRATISGDSVSLVTLAMWGRLITRSGSDPESPAREVPISAKCVGDPKCEPFLARMASHAAKLREGK
jgi:hypothetical protein